MRLHTAFQCISCTVWLLGVLAAPAGAAPLPAAAQSEVQALLVRLEASGCRFNRNGTWHSSAEARAHLQSKLDHLEKKAQIASAEAFIDMAASSSSVTGKAYMVQCQDKPMVTSAAWLAAQLAMLRKQAGTASAKP